MPLLSILIGWPVLAGLLIAGLKGQRRVLWAKWLALLVVMTSLILIGCMYQHFDIHTTAMQYVEDHAWIPFLHVHYRLGVDGISFPLIILTVYTHLVIILAAWSRHDENLHQYLALFLIMQGLLVGLFSALDALLFFFFWESTLIPLYLVIGMWGGPNRAYASMKFFIYTFLGSATFLVALLYMGDKAHSFSLTSFYQIPLSFEEQCLIFMAFLLAFAVKIPMWPVHTWLPDAHTQAPAGGSAVLAALMLKAGGYGFLRLTLPITPDASHALAPYMVALSLIAVIYIGWVALSQTDMKRLIAYSSIAHMGFVVLGCFMVYSMLPLNASSVAFATWELQGALMQMVSHGLSSAAMFLACGMLYERMHTHLIADFGGVARTMPVLAGLFLVFVMANVGLPGTSGFVGEFLVITGAMKASFFVAAAAALTLILGAAYSLRMMRQVFYGQVCSERVAALQDINTVDRVVLWLLVLPVVGLGFFPGRLLQMSNVALHQLVLQGLHSKLL